MELEEFLDNFIPSWKQGQHVVEIGPAGQGKTTLGLEIIQERVERRGSDEKPVEAVIFATKSKDPVLDELGWPAIEKWPPGYGKPQVILWPKFKTPEEAVKRQRQEFMRALREIFASGGRTLYFDEEFYLENQLRMKRFLDQFWTQARSLDITIVAGTQRPRDVSRQMFANASWAILFRTYDEDDLRRLGEITGGISGTRTVKENVSRLEKYEFIAIQRETGKMVRSRTE